MSIKYGHIVMPVACTVNLNCLSRFFYNQWLKLQRLNGFWDSGDRRVAVLGLLRRSAYLSVISLQWQTPDIRGKYGTCLLSSHLGAQGYPEPALPSLHLLNLTPFLPWLWPVSNWTHVHFQHLWYPAADALSLAYMKHLFLSVFSFTLRVSLIRSPGFLALKEALLLSMLLTLWALPSPA